jgi:hypothetical protein
VNSLAVGILRTSLLSSGAGRDASLRLDWGSGDENGIILPGFPLFKIVRTVVGRVNPGKEEFSGYLASTLCPKKLYSKKVC